MSEIIDVVVTPSGPNITAVVQGGGVGPAGAAGSPGASVNLQVSGGYIQWQHVGDSSWTNLIAVSSLVGATGATGATGAAGQNGTNGASVNLQVSGGYIQWQHVGDSSWTNLIAVSSLVGATGATGATGPAGSDASVTSSNVITALGYTPLRPSNNLSDLSSASTARTNLGLGTAATQASTAFDSSGAASTAQAYAIQRANHTGTQAISTITGLQTALDGKQASGTYATLVSGTVPSSQLPSYVDDVLEYANLAGFPGSGETGKIYVDKATNKIYRWSGSTYIEISPSPGSTDSVTEGSTNLYFTAARAISALTSTLSSYATSSSVISAINALSSVYTTTSAVASQITSALSGYATQSWVMAQGFATSLGVSSAISSAISSLGLGTAATYSASDFDAAGAAATAQSNAETYATSQGYITSISGQNLSTANNDAGFLTDAPNDGLTYARKSEAWIVIGVPSNSVAPTLSPSGETSTGIQLSVSDGTWTGSPSAYSYQWQQSTDGTTWTNISGETSSTFTPDSSYATKYVRASVIASNGFGPSSMSYSDATAELAVPSYPSGATAAWHLNDDGSGNVSLVDSTGNGHDLTNNNGVML